MNYKIFAVNKVVQIYLYLLKKFIIMKKLLLPFLLFISISFEILAQQNEVTLLINKQKEISNHIKILTDSIKTIELKINEIRLKEIIVF